MKTLLAISVFLAGALHMGCQNSEPVKLTNALRAQIEAEVKQAAIDHLNSKDAQTALDHYAPGAVVVTNTTLFSTLNEISESVSAYYKTLKEVNLAVWDEMFINVISQDAALVTATFRYSFTDVNNQRTDFEGVWTALFERHGDVWKIRVRHESVASKD